MAKKKEGRKAESGEQKARRFVKNLAQYDDFKDWDFSKFPYSMPGRFSLKLGPEIIGNVYIDWQAVVKKLFRAGLAMSKPKDLSDDEYAQQLHGLIKSCTSEERVEILFPYYSTVLHMAEFTPQKLNDAVMHLPVEGRQHVMIRREKERGSKNIPSAAKLAAWVGKAEEESIKKRLPEIRGGSDPEIEVSDEQCAKLSANYPELLQHWKNVKKWQKEGPNWRSHAKVDQSDTPDDLLDRLSDADPYRRQPSTIAHEHAARRCGIPADTYGLSTHARLRRRGDRIRGQSKS